MLMNLRSEIGKWHEKFWFWLAWRLPKKLVYFAAIRLTAFATQGDYSNTVVPELQAMEALKRWHSSMKKR